MNISSIIIHVKPVHLREALDSINNSEDYEYHLHNKKGKIIITIEGVDTKEEINKLKKLQAMPHIISAELVFSYSEDELNQERDKLEKIKEHIPDWLNDPTAKIKDIKYRGDLKGLS
ncbi:chaperone NapD [Bacteroidota bacterium]